MHLRNRVFPWNNLWTLPQYSQSPLHSNHNNNNIIIDALYEYSVSDYNYIKHYQSIYQYLQETNH